MVRGVATHLMFAGEASAALELYAAVFQSFVSTESSATVLSA